MTCDQREQFKWLSESRTSFMLRRMPQSHCQSCHYDFQLGIWYENQFQIICPNMHCK